MGTEQLRVCRSEDAVLLIVDVQERLAAAMPQDARETVFRNTGILLQSAEKLGIPVLVSEQYPKGLGPTESAVLRHVGESAQRFEKTSFSCGGADEVWASFDGTGRKQTVVAGMEAHVCVLQTALELRSRDIETYVVEDAICSRNPSNHRNAVQRLRESGVIVTNTESVVFEWLKNSRHEHFKALSALLR